MPQGKIISRKIIKILLENFRVEATCTVEDKSGKEYFILDAGYYLEIDSKLRSPAHKGFLNNAQEGDEVSFEFIIWEGINVITEIELTKLAKRIWY